MLTCADIPCQGRQLALPFSECLLILALGSIINNEAHACDVKKEETFLRNSDSFKMDEKIQPVSCLPYHVCDMRVLR